MTPSNSSVLRGYFDEVFNQRRLDVLSKYLSEEFVGHGTPYVGMGFAPDYSDGAKVTVQHVNPGSPAEGKLMVGDEILRVADGERTWETFEELRSPAWGQGVVGTSVTMWVQREGVEHEITFVRGMMPGFEFPYHLVEPGIGDWIQDWPEYETRLVQVLEAGDLVAYHAENEGHNARYGRSAVWAEFGMVRVRDGKITDWWSAEDSFSLYKQLGYFIEEPPVVEA